MVGDRIEQLLDAVPFDADDLPGYARRLRKFNLEHPDLVRLLLWHNLERPLRLGELPAAVDSTRHKLRALATAQAAGTIDATMSPEALLSNVLALVHADLLGAPHGPSGPEGDDGLELAVQRLVEPGR